MLRFQPEFTGLEDHVKSFWVQKASDDIWRGSLKHEDWKPVKTAIPNGAWEPKLRKVKTKKAKGRGARPKGIEAMGNLVNGTGTYEGGFEHVLDSSFGVCGDYLLGCCLSA